jgi:hypothetical protein
VFEFPVKIRGGAGRRQNRRECGEENREESPEKKGWPSGEGNREEKEWNGRNISPMAVSSIRILPAHLATK